MQVTISSLQVQGELEKLKDKHMRHELEEVLDIDQKDDKETDDARQVS
jgi:hypothetical protein